MDSSIVVRTVRAVLEPWCAAGLTGALRVLDPPGGSVYLVDGLLAYADCPLVCGLDRLLVASGRLPSDVWRDALATGRAGCRVGEVLVEDGHLSRAELELYARTALYDALFFLADSGTDAHFETGATHVLGPVAPVDLETAGRELDLRRRALEEAWPHAVADIAAVVPARRLAGHQVTLTALQWEIVANADRRRSPLDLARLLGRDGYGTLLEVRRLARAGLVEPGRPSGRARPPEVTPAPPLPEPPLADALAEGEPLPRRPVPEGETPVPPPRTGQHSEAVLRRVLAALEAL